MVEEQTIVTMNARMPVGVGFYLDEAGSPVPENAPSEWPSQLKFPHQFVHYTYQYDSYGNGIEPTVNRSDSRPYSRCRGHTY